MGTSSQFGICGTFVKSRVYETTLLIVIIVNCLFIGVAVQQRANTFSVPTYARDVETMFCIFFVSELLFRVSILRVSFLVVDGKISKWNCFDVIIVAIMLLD